jgi:hypothetical protein
VSAASKSRALDDLLRWAAGLAQCLDHGLSDEERQALDRWESSPEFTSTDDWPGWGPRIGLRPDTAVAPRVLLRRSA